MAKQAYKVSDLGLLPSGTTACPGAYDNCDGVDDDIRALYDVYGDGVSERIERLGEELGKALTAARAG